MSSLKVNNVTRAGGSGVPDLGGVPANRLLPSAWVNFNGTGVVAIRDAYNVASITDNGTGDYTVNFTTPMANTNYLVTPSASASSGTWGCYGVQDSSFPLTVNSARFRTVNSGSASNAIIDAPYAYVLFFGGQA